MNIPLTAALAAADESIRLKAALAAGSNPDPDLLDVLLERCAVEPDFYVRDMLTWALIRLMALGSSVVGVVAIGVAYFLIRDRWRNES